MCRGRIVSARSLLHETFDSGNVSLWMDKCCNSSGRHHRLSHFELQHVNVLLVKGLTTTSESEVGFRALMAFFASLNQCVTPCGSFSRITSLRVHRKLTWTRQSNDMADQFDRFGGRLLVYLQIQARNNRATPTSLFSSSHVTV